MTAPSVNDTQPATAPRGAPGGDRIVWAKLSLCFLPLKEPISDAKVLTGRQKPLTEVAILFCEIETRDGHRGMGFSYSKRAGGPGMFAHAREIADRVIGEDPNDIERLWTKLVWAGASVGRSGLATQAIAAIDICLWDLKAKRAGLPLSKLIGSHRDSVRTYNTSGGFLSTPLPEVLENCAASRDKGIGGIKIKVGQPDWSKDFERVKAVRKLLDRGFPLAVDANQQWDRPTAMRVGRALEDFDLFWIEEPLDAYDAKGHAMLAADLATPIATGEMLTSVAEHYELIRNDSVDFIQPDAGRVGGITQFLKIMTLADHAGLMMAPHFAMEIHLHLCACYPREPWVEHFDWLEPLFDETLEIRDGRMVVPDRPGLGATISGQARAWVVDSHEVGKRA